jgi:indole-3-glycerol phosphate synthase
LLADLHALALDLGLAALVEVHDEAETERALRIDPSLIGINNRDLRTFKVDLNITQRLGKMVPSGTILVGESGIKTAEDVRALGNVHAILVGETVVTAADRVGKLRELSSVKRG